MTIADMISALEQHRADMARMTGQILARDLELSRLRTDLAQQHRLNAELADRLLMSRQLNLELAERLAAASAVLTRCAERGSRPAVEALAASADRISAE